MVSRRKPKTFKGRNAVENDFFFFSWELFFLNRWQNLLTTLHAEKLGGLPSFFFFLSPCKWWWFPNLSQLASWNWCSPFHTGQFYLGKSWSFPCCVACSAWQEGGHLLLPCCCWPCTSGRCSQACVCGWGTVGFVCLCWSTSSSSDLLTLNELGIINWKYEVRNRAVCQKIWVSKAIILFSPDP